MSLTSLSSCEHSECCQCLHEDSYGRIYQPGPPFPFFHYLNQPLVYYAHLQPNETRSKRDGNKNCFVKAFKWYTQDFTEMRKREKLPPDLASFANWLDTKYNEYLSESDAQQSAPRSHQLSTFETTSCPPRQPTTTRRFPRMRSPWGKRKSSSKTTGDVVPCKSKSPTASCQFILHPQDLIRPASACYHPPTCPNKSNATIMSNENIATKKIAPEFRKSRSLTSISHENVTRNCIDVITVQEGPTNVLIVPCDQNCKPKARTVEETKQKSVNSSKLRPSSIEPCKLVQQFCDQSCKAKQNFPNMEEVQRVPSQSQRIETRSDETCIFKQEHSVDQTVSQTLTKDNYLTKENLQNYGQRYKVQKKKIPYHQIKDYKLGQDVKMHVRDIVCDQNCTTKEKCSLRQDIRDQSITQSELEACEQREIGIHEYNKLRNTLEDQAISKRQKYPNEQECEIKLETEQFSSTSELMNTRGGNIAIKENDVGRRIPAKSERADVSCDVNCPLNQTRNFDQNCSAQTQGTVFPERRVNMFSKLLNLAKVDIECQCPEEQPVDFDVCPRLATIAPESTDLPCKCIVVESFPPYYAQAQQNKHSIQQYLQSKIQTPISYLSKKLQKSKVDVECQCPEEDSMQYTPSRPLYSSPQSAKKSFISYHVKKNFSKEDVSCQCSETDIKNKTYRLSELHTQPKTKSFTSYAQQKKSEKMIDVLCECSEEDLLQRHTARTYRQYDSKPFDNTTCLCPKPLRAITPVCDCQRTDSYAVRNLIQCRRGTSSREVFRSNSVQTSVHSINLENVNDYEFFMKIVCADKLNNDFQS